MKKIQSSLSKEYSYLSIFLDDLKQIEELFKTHCSRDYCIETEEYKYESIEELNNHLKLGSIKNIKMSAHEPYVSFEVDIHNRRLYTSADNDSAIAAFHNINDVLLKCKTKMSWLYGSIFFFSMNGLLWILIIFMDMFPDNFLLVIIGLIMFIFYCFGKGGYLTLYGGRVKILFIEKQKQKNFFQRNKDQLILVLITAFLSILGTLFVLKYL